MDLVVVSLSGASNLFVKSGLRSACNFAWPEDIKVDVRGNIWPARRRRITVGRWRLGGLKAKPWSMLCNGCFRFQHQDLTCPEHKVVHGAKGR